MYLRKHGATVMMDNTWGTPLYFKPFLHGVDVSIQATTKYIVGHSDVIMGSVTCTREAWPGLKMVTTDYGQTASPGRHSLPRTRRTPHPRAAP